MIYTIGHSNHPLARFIALLAQHRIAVLADVRSTPFSRFNPQFNQKALQQALPLVGIEYRFLGRELGARTSDPECYEGERVSYARLAGTAAFREGLNSLLAQEARSRVAIMCAEKEPLDCHRTILVARELERRGASVTHILPDGMLEPNDATLVRLRARLKLQPHDLFGGPQASNEQAYDLQARKIAYVRPQRG